MARATFVFVSPPEGVERNCGSCKHRSYGDQRLVSQCLLKATGDYQRRAFIDNHNVIPPKPRARDFGAKCLRWQTGTPVALPANWDEIVAISKSISPVVPPTPNPVNPVAAEGPTEAATGPLSEPKETT